MSCPLFFLPQRLCTIRPNKQSCLQISISSASLAGYFKSGRPACRRAWRAAAPPAHPQQVIPPHAPPLVDIALREVGVVRGDEQVFACPQRRVIGQRLLVKDVERGGGDPFGVGGAQRECRCERLVRVSRSGGECQRKHMY
eukprot:scaffold5926_cov65-Phaeocystis_antarctica.AAC.3